MAGRRARYLSIALGVLIPLVVFGLVFPQAVSYQQALEDVRSFAPGWLVALVLASVLNLLVYPAPTLVCVPDLTYGRGFVVRQSAYAMSNLTPVGGALAVGTQYSVLCRFGVPRATAAAAVSADAVWAYLLTLGLPTIALLALVASGSTGFALPAVAGTMVVVGSVVVLMLVLRSERGTQRLGQLVQRLLHRVYTRVGRHEPPVAQALLAFRGDARELVARRWAHLTVADAVTESLPALVLWCALGGLGQTPSPVSALEAYTAYALAIALNAIPITPGGLGISDGALVALLVSFGATSSAALAADVVWRLAWFVPQMAVGGAVLAGHLLAVRREV